MVLAGAGEIIVRDADGTERTVTVDGTPRSYEIVKQDANDRGVLTVDVPAGVEVYSFTFG